MCAGTKFDHEPCPLFTAPCCSCAHSCTCFGGPAQVQGWCSPPTGRGRVAQTPGSSRSVWQPRILVRWCMGLNRHAHAATSSEPPPRFHQPHHHTTPPTTHHPPLPTPRPSHTTTPLAIAIAIQICKDFFEFESFGRASGATPLQI